MAFSLYRRRKFDDCTKICSQMLDKNPYDQAAWTLKMRALTEQVYVDEIEVDDEGIAEMLDDNAVAQVARPGTSLKTPGTAQSSFNPAIRPTTQSGRPLTGVVRPGTQSGKAGSMEQAIKTPRTAHTARPVTSASGRFVRLGTASMLSTDGQFINLARLDFSKYSQKPALAKPLFEYIFYHENDMRNALQIAALATEACAFKDWWWKIQLGKTYYRLGLFRDAEKQYSSAVKQQPTIDNYLYLSKIFVKLDQPLNAITKLKEANEKFPYEPTILQAIARIQEALDEAQESLKYYKEVLRSDNTNVEAIACIATNYFYSDQPEVALKFYRRLLQIGVYNSELFNNIGLCCFYAQQYDMIISCFDRALSIATNDQQLADVWFNVGHVALGVGDTSLAYQCFRLSLVYSNDNADAYNNLGVLEMSHGRTEMARSFFQAAQSLGPHMFEPHYNYGYLANTVGDLQSSYQSIKHSLSLFKDHASSKVLLDELQKQFSVL